MSDEGDEPVHRAAARIERDVAALPARARNVLLVDLIRQYLRGE